MRKKDNPKATSYRNEDGSCSLQAIGYYFDLDLDAIKHLFKKVGRRDGDGTTTHQCSEVIRTLALINRKTVTYEMNRKKLSVSKFLRTYPNGHFILNQDGHISVAKNGVSIDDWTADSFKLFGWWELKDKPSEFESFFTWPLHEYQSHDFSIDRNRFKDKKLTLSDYERLVELIDKIIDFSKQDLLKQIDKFLSGEVRSAFTTKTIMDRIALFLIKQEIFKDTIKGIKINKNETKHNRSRNGRVNSGEAVPQGGN